MERTLAAQQRITHMRSRQMIQSGLILIVAIALLQIAGAQSKSVVWPASSIKWTDNPAVAGAQQAVLWGDPTKGAYGALKQVPAGTALAMHTHKNDSRVIMIKGSISLEMDSKKTALPAGSFALLPGGVPHAATCGTSGPCEYFEEMSGAFDSTPAKK
jgi:quercetin dioxygenase-like cupin family protein